MSRFRMVTEDPWEPGKRIPPPTEKQVVFIQSLCGKLGYSFDEWAPANVREAAETIDTLKEELGWE